MAEKTQKVAEKKGGKDERMWGMLCHLSALTLFIGIPFGNVFGPLIIWLVQRNQYPFVDKQGKAALNFQISMTIYLIISGFLCLVVVGFILLPVLLIIELVYIITVSIKVSNGEPYQYPFTIQFLK